MEVSLLNAMAQAIASAPRCPSSGGCDVYVAGDRRSSQSMPIF
jgi:hypothetical protein